MSISSSAPGAGSYILFVGKGTSSIATEILFEELVIPHRAIPVNVRGGQTRSAAYRRINPAGQVPCLVRPDGRVLTESAAILLTLCDYRPHHPFAADWCNKRIPEILRWLFFLTSGMTTAYSMLWRPEKFTDEETGVAAVKRMAATRAADLWDVVEAAFEADYFFQDGYSIVDAYILMQILWDPDRNALFASHPNLHRLFDLLASRAPVAKVIGRHSTPDFWKFDDVNLEQIAGALAK